MHYIITIAELQEKAFANLGPMTEGTYDEFMAKANEEAAATGVQNPRLLLSLLFRPGGHPDGVTGAPYPIKPQQWAEGLGMIDDVLEEAPTVYVVDGDLYTAGI